MQWSRSSKGNKAVSFVSVDSEVSDQVLKKLRELSGIMKATKLNF
jgi:D-3-phosphoglycerate dehydrogenase